MEARARGGGALSGRAAALGWVSTTERAIVGTTAMPSAGHGSNTCCAVGLLDEPSTQNLAHADVGLAPESLSGQSGHPAMSSPGIDAMVDVPAIAAFVAAACRPGAMTHALTMPVASANSHSSSTLAAMRRTRAVGRDIDLTKLDGWILADGDADCLTSLKLDGSSAQAYDPLARGGN